MSAVGDGSVKAAYAWLSRACEPGNRWLWAYVSALGPVEVAAQLAAGDGPARLQRSVGDRAGRDHSLGDLAAAAAIGARLVTPEDAEWPTEPVELMAQATASGHSQCVPPLALWVRGSGRIDELTARAVAIVGARASTSYGEYLAGDIAAGVSEREVTVVSGGALGIDAAAHRGALGVRGPTVAILGCGIDRAYPKANAELLARIAAVGAIVSEWHPGAAPMGQRFLVRNRLIAGLTLGTVVVEAALRSGSRSTAARARDMGKAVMAVPGPVTSDMSTGVLAMLRDEAALAVGSSAHVLEAIGAAGVELLTDERGADRPGDELDASLKRLLDAVPARRAVPADRIAEVAASTAGEVLGGLTRLELDGYVEQTDGGWRLARTRT